MAAEKASLTAESVSLAAKTAVRISVEAAVQESVGGRSGQTMQQGSVKQPVQEESYLLSDDPSIIMSTKKGMRVPKFDERSHFHLGYTRFQTYLRRGV